MNINEMFPKKWHRVAVVSTPLFLLSQAFWMGNSILCRFFALLGLLIAFMFLFVFALDYIVQWVYKGDD